MTSYRTMKTNEFKDAIFYRVACDCGSDEHDLHFEFEKDSEIPEMIFLNFYKKLVWSSYWGDNDKWYKNFWLRIKGATKMIFKGYVEVEESFILRGEDHIDSFIEALEEGKQYMKNLEGEEDENNSEMVSET